MLDELLTSGVPTGTQSIRHSASALPEDIPTDHIGPVVLRGTGRMVWWTGRVAIGLRHQPQRYDQALGESARWIQSLMLDSRGRAHR